MTDSGHVHLRIEAGVASVVFDRSQARNAMTWAMYEQLMAICRQLQTDASVRVATFRGAGGEAFVAGTDIAQFQAFRAGAEGGEDGVAYERQIDACMELLTGLPMPTVAVVEGWCVGGGLAIASGCDFRLATPSAKFGVPIAKTLGNCLSMSNLARLQALWGAQRLRRMLLLAEMINAEEALACG
ncbi:MAG: enoyl-CoA hydratase-related protein, partial [Armatimonadota bacterium]